jgi:hypothetical protein
MLTVIVICHSIKDEWTFGNSQMFAMLLWNQRVHWFEKGTIQQIWTFQL